VLQQVVRSLKASPVDRVLVVLGHRSEEVAATLAGAGAEVVLNPRYREGMLSSVQKGAAAAHPETEWLLIALGDQPWLRPETVSRLLDAAAGSAGIVVPSYGNRRGHPLLIHRRFREEIAGLPADGGLRELLRRHADAVRHVMVPDEEILRDMDTPEDYRRELERLEASQANSQAPRHVS
jgi:molybdenum cofactor cytidylyltransferase